MRRRFHIRVEWLALSAALLITAATYLQSAFFEFVYDDFGQIVYNPKIKSFRLTLTYFTSNVWSQVTDIGLYYRPLYMVWLRVNHAFFGLEPLYWHLHAITLHRLVCLLLYFFVYGLTLCKCVAAVSLPLFGRDRAHGARI